MFVFIRKQAQFAKQQEDNYLQRSQMNRVDQQIHQLCLQKLEPKPSVVKNKSLGPIVEIPLEDYDDVDDEQEDEPIIPENVSFMCSKQV